MLARRGTDGVLTQARWGTNPHTHGDPAGRRGGGRATQPARDAGHTGRSVAAGRHEMRATRAGQSWRITPHDAGHTGRSAEAGRHVMRATRAGQSWRVTPRDAGHTGRSVVAGHASSQAAREAASPSRRPTNVTEESREGLIIKPPIKISLLKGKYAPRMEAAGDRRLICLICLIC